jgi:hypothetical protein
LVLADAAALAQWLAATGELDAARSILAVWLGHGERHLPDPHYARGELHLVLAEIGAAGGDRDSGGHAVRAAAELVQLPSAHPLQQRLDRLRAARTE